MDAGRGLAGGGLGVLFEPEVDGEPVATRLRSSWVYRGCGTQLSSTVIPSTPQIQLQTVCAIATHQVRQEINENIAGFGTTRLHFQATYQRSNIINALFGTVALHACDDFHSGIGVDETGCAHLYHSRSSNDKLQGILSICNAPYPD